MLLSRLRGWLSPSSSNSNRASRKRRHNRAAAVEWLEGRHLLAVSPIEVWGAADLEGDSGSKHLEFWVHLTQPISEPLEVSYETADLDAFPAAEAGSDYAWTSGTLTFEPGGLTSQVVTVEIFGDTQFEFDERFLVVFTPSDGSEPQFTEGLIYNDDEFPTLSIEDVTIAEGSDNELHEMIFTVTRSGAKGDWIHFVYETIPGTADDDDFLASSGFISLAPGETTATIPIVYWSDTIVEPDEEFYISIPFAYYDILGGQYRFETNLLAVGTLLNDDFGAVLQLPDHFYTEGNAGPSLAYVELLLEEPLDDWLVVHVSSIDGTATAGSDYSLIDEYVYFAPGETFQAVEFTIYGDLEVEPDETFTIEVRGTTGVLLASATVTIFNDDYANEPPVASAGGPYVVSEAGQVVLDASGSTDPNQPSATLTYEWDLDYDGFTFQADRMGREVTVNAVDVGWNGPMSLTVAVRVTDEGGLSSIATATVDVFNLPPTIDIGPDLTVSEGTTVVVAAQYFDVDPLTFHWRLVDSSNGQQVPDQNEAVLTFVPTDNGTYTFELTVTDNDGASALDSVVVTATNVEPLAAISGPAAGVTSQPLVFQLAAFDVSQADMAGAFLFEIDWMDGSSEILAAGASPDPLAHVFASAGTYAVEVVAIDKDGGRSAPATWQVEVATTLVADGVLYVGGGDGDDTILVNPGPGGSVRVAINGVDHGTFTPTVRVVAYGGAGNDTIVMHRTLALDAWFFGGPGDDFLSSARGNDVLSGGDGNDVLWSGQGRDLLIGGAGLDQLTAGQDDDILVSGTSRYETDEQALAAIMAEWTSARDFLTRQRNLSNGTGSADRLNDDYFLELDSSVFDDEEDDSLSGGPGLNWSL